MHTKDALGAYGERVAERHLIQQGLQVLDRNWRCRDGEIDIVALDGDVLVFCEVKTRRSSAFGDPAEAVSRGKSARLRRLALAWLAEHRDGRWFPELRFDVVAVIRPVQGVTDVRHLRAAF